MPMQKQTKSYHRHRWIWPGILLGGIAFLLVTGFIFVQREKSEIRRNVTDTLTTAKATCQKYDDYRLGMTIKDLYAAVNKANVLSIYTVKEDLLNETMLKEYTKLQYLTGIMVFDGQLRLECSVENDQQVSRALWKQVLAEGEVLDILHYPQKVVADQIALGERNYDYAIVTRRDEAGVIVCYSDTTQFKNDKYEVSFENMLNANLQSNDEVLVVTDGLRVLSSNEPSLDGIAVEDCPVTNVIANDHLRRDATLIKLKYDGTIWYGMHDMYRDYYLYVFYGSNRIYARICWQIVIAAVFYAGACLIINTLVQRRRREKLLQLEKEYQLINAIANIYSVNLIIHLDDNTWEAITQTEDSAKVTLDIEKADEMLEVFTRKFIIRQDQDEFRKFVDMNTAPQRLQGKPFIGDTFEGQNGRWYQMLLIPQNQSQDAGSLTTVMLLVRDVSEQKRKELTYQERLHDMAEQAACANAAKTDFLRRMSHDIRTPINGIRGMAQIGMTGARDGEAVRECFEKIVSESDLLLEMVNNILSMSKLEAEEVETENEAFDLREVIQNAVNRVAPQALEAGIKFECDKPVGEHWHLIGSPLNVQRIFQNIMDNAVKYNRPAGSVQISCRENEFDGERATFIFVCADTGIGMSPEFQAHVFEAFSQGQKTARTRHVGSGLGLPIAKKTVELMGGTIGFVSRQGKGTVFSVTIPLKVDLDYKSEEELLEGKPERIDGIRILMAEDNELNRKIATYMLTKKGALVTEAEDGKRAVDLFAESAPGDFDIILMDIMMPVMNGLEAAKAIRAMDRSDAASIPIIALSANAFSDDVAASKASGMNEHLSKPIDFARVAAIIYKYIKK